MPKVKPPPPWLKYKGPPGSVRWKLLIPGWGGWLGDDELQFIMEHLKADEKLRLWWGIPGRWRSLPAEIIRRVAAEGDEEDLGVNRRLARPRQPARKVV
jgi:hypothetical protein